MRVRDRIILGVRLRLEANAAHKEAIRRALPILALPRNAATATRCLYRTVDSIWYAAGDTATDHNFYTKRGLLAAVYSSTLLYWLNDSSEDQEPTWAFLDRRIDQVMQIPAITGRLRERLCYLPNPLRMFEAGRDAWTRRGRGL